MVLLLSSAQSRLCACAGALNGTRRFEPAAFDPAQLQTLRESPSTERNFVARSYYAVDDSESELLEN
jgi:hypothetical protein